MSAVRRDSRRSGHSSSRSRTRASTPPANSDFVDFLHKVVDLMFFPITYPLRVIRDLVTSPITISVALKVVLMVMLVVASAVFSILAVGAFWWSWGTGGPIEVEGWLVYGSRNHRTPHTVLSLPTDRFQEDLPYDVQVELELVRPTVESGEMGNFMVTLELRSFKNQELALVRAAQPSLPPPPLHATLFSLPSFPIPPCIIPWPFRFLCPSRFFGYAGQPHAQIKERRRKGSVASPARGNDVVLLTKELIEQVIINPGRGDMGIGSAFVSIGREDTTSETDKGGGVYREVRTTGWVVVRFVPHPTGVRWLMSNPLPPLLILPPVSLTLTLSSAVIGFLVISFWGSKKPKDKVKKVKVKAITPPDSREASRERRERRELRESRELREPRAERSRTPSPNPLQGLARVVSTERARLPSFTHLWDRGAPQDVTLDDMVEPRFHTSLESESGRSNSHTATERASATDTATESGTVRTAESVTETETWDDENSASWESSS